MLGLREILHNHYSRSNCERQSGCNECLRLYIDFYSSRCNPSCIPNNLSDTRRHYGYSTITAVPICGDQTPGNTYQWSAVNGAIVSGQGTNIASVMWSQDTIGSLSVVESNGYCTDTAHLAIRTHIGLEELLRIN